MEQRVWNALEDQRDGDSPIDRIEDAYSKYRASQSAAGMGERIWEAACEQYAGTLGVGSVLTVRPEIEDGEYRVVIGNIFGGVALNTSEMGELYRWLTLMFYTSKQKEDK